MSRKPTQKTSSQSLSEAITTLRQSKIASQNVVDLQHYRTSHHAMQKCGILVIDADEGFRNSVKRSLEWASYEVYLGTDAMELAVMLERYRADLILLSIEIPWVNGLELCELLKTHPMAKDIPIVLIGEEGQAYDGQAISQSGCEGFLCKPFENDTLSKVINDMLGSKKKLLKP